MGTPYIGEIRMFGGNFAPVGWAFCNGQTLSISQNSALFNLIGTTYGGDGTQTFNLPDLQGRLPVHQGPGFVIGTKAGSETVTLTGSQVPGHTHGAGAKLQGTTNTPGGNVYAGGGPSLYKTNPGAQMNAATIGPNAGGQPHDNMMPFLTVSFIIALEGIYPSQN